MKPHTTPSSVILHPPTSTQALVYVSPSPPSRTPLDAASCPLRGHNPHPQPMRPGGSARRLPSFKVPSRSRWTDPVPAHQRRRGKDPQTHPNTGMYVWSHHEASKEGPLIEQRRSPVRTGSRPWRLSSPSPKQSPSHYPTDARPGPDTASSQGWWILRPWRSTNSYLTPTMMERSTNA